MKRRWQVVLGIVVTVAVVCAVVFAIKSEGFKNLFGKNGLIDQTYIFDLEINDEAMGSVSVDAIDPEVGTVMTLKAKPNYGYIFVGWYVDDQLLSAEAEFTYIMPERDVTMVGVFAKDEFDVKVISKNPGFTAGIDAQYEYLSEISIVANDIEGTEFVAWFSDGEVIGKDKTLTLTVEKDITIYAEYYVPGEVEIYSWPTVSAATIGTPLSEVELVGGSANVLGYFKWANPDEPVYNDGEYIVVFVPFVTHASEYETMIGVPIASEVLSAPEFTIENGEVKWNSVAGATCYKVKINDSEYVINADEYSYTLPKEMGEYYVSVEAVGDGVSTVTSTENAVERYVPPKPTAEQLNYTEGKCEYDQNGNMIKFAGRTGVTAGFAEVVEGSVEVHDDYIVFRIEVDVAEYLSATTKKKVLDLNKFNISLETNITIHASVTIYDPDFYVELDLDFPTIMEDLVFGVSYDTMTTTILDIDINGEFVEPELRRGTLHLLFIDLVGLEEPLYKWSKVEIPIFGNTVTVELALCFDAVGAIGASLYMKNIETANYEAKLIVIHDGVPVFVPKYEKNMTSNITEVELEGELDFNINCARVSASLKLNKGTESLSLVRLNLDYFNIESDLSGKMEGTLNTNGDIEDTTIKVDGEIDGSYRIYGQITFEYYLEIRLNFIFLPLDDFKIKVIDGSYVLMEWELMKGGIPKTPYKDDAIHTTTPIYATDTKYEYFIESDGDFSVIDLGQDNTNYEIGNYTCTFDTEEIVDIDNYYVYVLSGSKLRRVGRTAGTERTIVMDVNYVLHSDRNYIYYTTKTDKNKIVKLYRSDVLEDHATFLSLPSGYEAVSMRYDNLLNTYVIYALEGSNEYFFTYDGTNLVRRGINEHKYWQRLSLGDDTVAYYRLDKSGIVKECFIRTPNGGVTHADSALSIGMSRLGLFVVTEKEGQTYKYELGLYPIGGGSHSYVKIAEVSDPTVANRIADDDGYAYFVDMNASAFMIYKTDGNETHPVCISAYGETLGSSSVKAEIHGDWLFVYKYSRGEADVIYTVDLLTLETAPYLTNGNHFEYDKASGSNLDISLSGDATVLGLYISALSDDEYASLKKGYEEAKENWEKVDKFMSRYCDFWKKKDISSDDIIEYIENYSELFKKASVIVSAVDYAAGDLSHGEFPLVNLNSKITVYNDDLLAYSYGVHTAYLVTSKGILPVTVEFTDSRQLAVNQDTIPEFDKGNPEHIMVNVGVYDSKATIDVPSGAYGKTQKYDANLNPTGVYEYVFYSTYLSTLPYGENKITLTDKNGEKVTIRINVVDSRSPADTEYSKHYDLSYSQDVVFNFNAYDEKYITKVEGNDIPSVGAYQISPYGGSITFSRNYLTTLLPGNYFYTVTTSEKSFDVCIVVIETVAPKASCEDEFDLAKGGYFEIDFEKNDAALFDIYFDSVLVDSNYWYYSMVDGKIYIDADYLEKNVAYGELDISIHSVIYSGDNVKSHTISLKTNITDTRTPTVSIDEITHIILDETPAISIKVALYGRRVTEVTIVESGTTLGYKMNMVDSYGRTTFRDGYLILPASYFVDKVSEGDHTIRVKIDESEFDIPLTLIDERLPRATKSSSAYNIKDPADGDYVIRLFGETFLSLSRNGVVLPEEAYTFDVHNVDNLYHIIVINQEYLSTLGINYSDVLEFTVQTSVNSFKLYLRANSESLPDDNNPGGGGGGGGGGFDWPEYNPATQISAYPSSFDVDVVNMYNIVFSMNYGSNNNFGYLRHGLRILTQGEDYIIENNKITIFASYFSSLSGYDPYTFTIVGSKGRSTTVTVNFYDSRDPYVDGELSFSYDKYDDNYITFDAHMFDSKVKYVKVGGEYIYSGFGNTIYAVAFDNSLLDRMPYGRNVIEIGFNDSSVVFRATLDTHDSTLYYTRNTNVDKALYALEDGTVFIPYSLYEGSVTSVSSSELSIVSFNNNGVTVSGFKNASYGKKDITIVANGHTFVMNVTIFDSRKPTTTDADNTYQFDKGKYEYTLDPNEAKKYDMFIELELYDNSITVKDILGDQSIRGNNIKYEDYDRSGNDYYLSYLYLYRLPDGEYTFYISTTDGDVEFRVVVSDSRAPYLVDSDPTIYDYEDGGAHHVGVHLYSDRVVSLSYIDIITGNVVLLAKTDYSLTDLGKGNYTLNIERGVFERGDFYNGYTYKFTLATNTERTLSFNVTIQNGPLRPFYVTYYSVPWKESEPEVLIETQILYEGEFITRPDDPSHEYYHFLGFYTERTDGELFDFSQPVSDDVNIFLHWLPKTYTITLMSDDQVWRLYEVQYLSNIPVLPLPTKTGYTFVKWTTEEGIRFNLSGKAMPHENITVYAQWEINTYTVTFKHYNGTVLKQETVEAFADATAPDMPSIDYYTFKGWDKFYTDVLSDMVVTAVYSPNKYDITYELNGGENPVGAPMQYTYEGGVKLPSPTMSGHLFMGWYLDSSFTGTKLVEIPYGTIPGLTLYAKWQPVHTITFDTAGGAAMDDCYVPIGSTVTLPKAERGGCNFLGWYDDEGQLISGSITPTEDMTVHAKWERVVVKYENEADRIVTDLGHYGLAQSSVYDQIDLTALSEFFDSRYVVNFRVVLTMADTVSGTDHIILYNATNGEIINPGSDSAMSYNYAISQGMVYECGFGYAHGSKVTDKLIEFTVPAEKCGDYMTFRYDAKGNYSELWTIYNITVEVSIVDSANTFPINYVMNGGTNPVGAPSTYTVSGEVELPTPTRAGYNFAGWYTDEQFKGKPISVIPAEAPRGFTVYAKWNPGVYRVSLSAQYEGEDILIEGGAIGATYSLVYGSDFWLPTPAYTKGIIFLGWYTGAGGTGTQITDSVGKSVTNTTISADTTLYAKFDRVMNCNFIEITENSLGFILKPNSIVDYEVTSVALYLDGRLVQTSELTDDHYYRFTELTEGLEYEVRVSYNYKHSDQGFVTVDEYSVNKVTVYTPGSFLLSDVLDGAVEYNGHYYKLVYYSSNWHSSLQYAQDNGGYLVTLSSDEENAFVYNYIRSQGCNDAFIGFTDEGSEGSWHWVNGEKVVYTCWASGEPNNSSSSEHYGEYYNAIDGYWWNDIAVSGSSACIIEWGLYEIG